MVFEKGLSFYPSGGSLVDVPTCEKIGIYRGGNTSQDAGKCTWSYISILGAAQLCQVVNIYMDDFPEQE